jgi:hypothetical protein
MLLQCDGRQTYEFKEILLARLQETSLAPVRLRGQERLVDGSLPTNRSNKLARVLDIIGDQRSGCVKTSWRFSNPLALSRTAEHRHPSGMQRMATGLSEA